jgi:hypothetical protein
MSCLVIYIVSDSPLCSIRQRDSFWRWRIFCILIRFHIFQADTIFFLGHRGLLLVNLDICLNGLNNDLYGRV